MSEIFVPHVGNYKPGILPTDINNPGYWTNASARTLALVKPYLTAAEWHTLASECNALSKKHAAWSHPCGLPLLLCTAGICFCPLIYLACGTEQRVNDALAVSAIAAQLNAASSSTGFPRTSSSRVGSRSRSRRRRRPRRRSSSSRA